jgi:MoxR-like ATPase
MVIRFSKSAIEQPKDEVVAAADDMKKFIAAASSVVVGKDHQLKMAWCCVVAGGHLLIEDLPGMGKTTMVKTIARLLDLPWKRVQCTSDMLPADITGGSVYDEASKSFLFMRGPIFANLVMADELNRASPKSQSAFLQAMEELSVTVDGQTYELPKPFIVMATQNSLDSSGTNPLPESQLDRFMMSLSLGVPTRDVEKKLLTSPPRADLLETLPPVISSNRLVQISRLASSVHVGERVADYIMDFAQWIRDRAHGVSPRTVLALTASSRAWALSHGRDFVTPADVQEVAISVLQHRLTSKRQGEALSRQDIVIEALKTVEVSG